MIFNNDKYLMSRYFKTNIMEKVRCMYCLPKNGLLFMYLIATIFIIFEILQGATSARSSQTEQTMIYEPVYSDAGFGTEAWRSSHRLGRELRSPGVSL